ncbi:MAG TPA: hypothetical protein PLV05_10000 [Verrucomicrobiota bacterium]|nr:O-antigen ligase family protein [Verrucomicrobiota bacterium]HRR65014.1 hypothetical protein [Candidatus Paceibacterota bacterium]HOF71159.1 hypothetical protein [Verrucomicrobiota bacterium]HOM45717.1 hypothetical protein [Verrucomicrobiota bacterium]HOQ56071.1 hypothetical protein [Verrucomicrobiota bacterium]
MANAIQVPRSHLILGLSLPLAVLVGYFLAEPMELGSAAVVLAVVGVLSVPLLMRWYHPVLIFLWNSAINPVVLPGRAGLWMVVTCIGLLFAVLNRAVNPKARFIMVPAVTYPLLALGVLVVITAVLRGGAGFASLGSSQYGGSRYANLLMGIAGYFALTSRRIPPSRAGLYVGCFFLSGLTYAISDLAILAGRQFYFLLYVFSTTYAADQLKYLETFDPSIIRFRGTSVVASAIYTYLLARFGIRGILDVARPWRGLIFLLAVAGGMGGGFRSYVALFGLTCIGVFYLEGLHRTRYLPALLAVALVGGALVLPQADKLPLAVQRGLVFLPGKFDSLARQSAKISIEWRVEMWKRVWPEVPKYLFLGKGYKLDPSELFLAQYFSPRYHDVMDSGSQVAGDYHSGPLSVLVPFGIFGTLAFLWFLVAGTRTLYLYYKHGSPVYQTVNTLLLAAFAVRAIFYFVGFGSLHTDMAFFTGLLGLGVALNGTPSAAAASSPSEQPDAGVELNTEYVKV